MTLQPGQVPRPSTSFIGRRGNVRAIVGMLEHHALVTLAGPGGAGKTRLAIEALTESLGPEGSLGRCASRASAISKFRSVRPDDVRWVELAELSEPSAVPHAAGRSVGALIDPRRDPTESLTAHLAGRRSLLCLDNAEHLLDPVADLTEAIAAACPDVTVLVTSREPLGLPGEIVWRVPPMADDEAEALFVQRAAAVRPTYHPDASDTAAIRRIVRHLDGIPLSLELAAAWLGTLSPQQVLAGLDDRFRFLVRGPRNAQRRHQTLASSIGWSHALLNDVDRACFRRLSVFAGSFPLAAALEVVAGSPVPDGEGLHSLARLIDKSLVVAEHTGGSGNPDGGTRYRMLETIRAFAAARLREANEAESTRGRHLRWYADLAESADRDHEVVPDRWRVTLQREYVDLRAALDRGLAGDDTDTVRRLAAALAPLWHEDRRGPEGLVYLRRAIALQPHSRTVVQARLLTGLALVADTASPLDLEYDAAIEALALATEVGDDRLRALCLTLAAVGASYTDFDRAWELADEAAATAPDDDLTQAGARTLQTIVLHHRDRHDEADPGFDAVVPGLLQLHRGIASTAMSFQATGALVTGHVARARHLAEDAVRVADPLGDHLRVGIARSALAVVHARAGRADDADDAVEPLLRLVGSSNEVFVTGLAHAVGVLAACRGEPAAAVEWFRRDASATDRGMDSWIATASMAELGRMLIRTGEVDEAGTVLERTVASATRLGMPRVLATARAAQADLAGLDPDSVEAAVEHAHAALAIRAEHRLRADLPDALEGVARHAAALRPRADDLRLGAAADAARGALGVPRSPDEQARWSSYLTDMRAHLGGPAFDAAWAEGERLTLDEAVSLARRARGSRGRPSTGWASLTPTELEVAALVAEGLNNPEVAARLLMSRGTVKTHLAHIFTKVGVGNRTELTAMVITRRITSS